jgi:hypothetical protein
MALENHETTETKRKPAARANQIVALLLVIVLAVGAYYRYVGLNWDDFTHLHPDERFLTQVLASLGNDINLSNQPETVDLLNTCQQRYPDRKSVV